MVRLLKLFLAHLNVLGSVLLLLQLPDVVNRCLQNGAFVPAHLAVPVEKKGQKTELRHFSAAVRMSHSPLSQFGFLKQFSKEQRHFFYLTDLRISGFGDHGTQLLYAVINVESSPPLNCRQAGMTGKKAKHLSFSDGI